MDATTTATPPAAGQAAEPYLRSDTTRFIDALKSHRLHLSEIEAIFTAPEFKNWHASDASISYNLVQFHPDMVLDKAPAEGGKWRAEFDVKASARAIVRLIGGKWHREGDCWHGETKLPSGRRLGVILHHVEEETPIEAIIP